jgi:outer membrane immunogenic protein
MIRRLLAGAAFTVVAATSVLASDMPPPRYMPPPRAPAFVPFFSWNGFYVGVNAGYGFGRSSWSDASGAVSTGSFNTSGGVAGGTLGYNMQWGAAIFGFETDLDWSSMKGSTTVTCVGTCKTSNNFLGTVRGRIGYAFDRFMPYLTAGMAYGDIRSTMVGVASFNSTNIGWTGGGGLEYAFLNNWSAKLEYLYVDLGKATCAAPCVGVFPVETKFNTNLVRAGVNLKF